MLAHRGGHWGLLQDTSNVLYKMIHSLLMKTMVMTHMIDKTSFEVPFDVVTLRKMCSKVFFTASDFLLEMIGGTDLVMSQVTDTNLKIFVASRYESGN